RLAAALAAAAGLVAAACAGDNSSKSSGPGATSVATTAAAVPRYVSKLAPALEAVVEQTHVPSAIVLVRSGTFGDATFTLGTPGPGGGEPVTAGDHARVGSVTKSMTATVILQLVQDGALALNDPVSKYVANVPNGDNITIAQLLDMRSGLHSYTAE